MIEIDDLHFAFGSRKLIKGLSLKISSGERVSLVGASGSGKTTLFRLLMGILTPDSGQIHKNEKISYMRQEDLLLPWRDVWGNLLLFTELGKTPEKPSRDPSELLKKVGLQGCVKMRPHELSGGMRQRLALAQCLLQNSTFLLLDEPFGLSDVFLREELYSLLREEGKGMLFITHDFRDAIALSDRIVVLGEGKIVADYAVRGFSEKDLLNEIREKLKSYSTLSQ